MQTRSVCPTLRISKILKICLALYFGSLVHHIVTSWQTLSKVDELLYVSDLLNSRASENSLSLWLAMVYGLVILFFVARLARANEELGAQGLRFTPRKAVWGYIIPVLNFYRPYQVMREAWQVSDKRSSPTNWQTMDGYALVKVWWMLYLAGIAIGMALGAYASVNMNLQDPANLLRASLQFGIAADVIAGIGALVMLAMVKTISDRMLAKWDLRFGPESVPQAKIQNP